MKKFLFLILLLSATGLQAKIWPRDTATVFDGLIYPWTPKDCTEYYEHLAQYNEIVEEMRKPHVSPPTDYMSGAILVLGGIKVLIILIAIARGRFLK